MSRSARTFAAAPTGGVALVLLITAFFGALWGLTGAYALPGGFSLAALALVAVATTVLLLAAVGLLRLPRQPSSSLGPNPFRSGPYILAVAFEAIAIPLAAVALNSAGYPEAVVSAVAVIVGLHFFGLVPAFRSRRFAVVGGAMVLVGLLSLLLPPGAEGTYPRGALVGLGCAFVLWTSALQPLIMTRRHAGSHPG